MINKTFRLFISSTFDDFADERNILNDSVFSELDTFCQEQGYNFQLIDLRWGVNNESSLNQNTLAICLDEVKRCRRLSPRPNFLIMAGERYGWIPLPTKILKTDFEEIVYVASKEEKALLNKWYVFDDNEIGGEHYLKARTGEYVDGDVWNKKEEELRRALVNCACSKLEISEEKRYRITASATEQEILEGLLDSSNTAGGTIAVLRTGYSKRDEDQTRINDLKKRIIRKMTDDGCEENILHLKCGKDYKKIFERKIIDNLKRNISAEIKRLKTEFEAVSSNAFLEQFSESDGIIIERKGELEKLAEYCSGEDCVPLFMSGDSGSGKTTVLAQYIRQNEGRFFCSFYGMSEKSYTLLDSLRDIAYQICSAFNISASSEINEMNMTEMFIKVLCSVPEDEKAIIIIDGLDMFNDLPDIRERVFPSELPKNVRLIVSCADNDVIGRFSQESYKRIHIGWFSREESGVNFDLLLRQKNRQIANPQQKNAVLKAMDKGATPLQLKLMSEICSAWHSADAVSELPVSSDEIALMHLCSMFEKYGHNRELVLYALALIAASPFGVMEEEIQTLLFRFESVEKYFVTEDRHGHNMKKVPFVIWSRLFYDLKGCLTLSRVRGYIVVRFSHQVFCRVFMNSFRKYYDEAADMLIGHYAGQGNYIKGTEKSNARKVFILPVLLRRFGKDAQLSKLLGDISYIDSAVKAGNIDEVISDIRYALKGNADAASAGELRRIYGCLQGSRKMLSCYYGEFLSCAYNFRLTDVKPIIECENTSAGGMYFPYSMDSKLKWSHDGSRYAVYGGSYIYICERGSGTELCRIYLEPKDQESVKAMGVYWFEEFLIGIVTSSMEIQIYDICSYTPICMYRIEECDLNTFVHYSAKNRLVIYQGLLGFCAYNLDLGEKQWDIIKITARHYDFEVDEANDLLLIKNQKKRCTLYNTVNGDKVAAIRLPRGKKKFLDFMNYMGAMKIGIHRIFNDVFLEYVSGGVSRMLAVYNKAARTKRYLVPPDMDNIVSWLPGERYLLINYPNMILAIDLYDNYRMGGLPAYDVKDVAWMSKDNVISYVSENNVRFAQIADFSLLPGNLGYCAAEKKNPRSKYSVIFKNVYKILKRIRDSRWLKRTLMKNNLMDYDVVFSLSESAMDMMEGFISARNISESRASSVVYAPDGKTAVCYEEKNALMVFDSKNNPILYIDKLKLSVFNNILKVIFSDDSSKLLIWRNASITVIDVETADKLLDLDVFERPIIDIWFRKDSSGIEFIMYDGNVYSYVFCDGKAVPEMELPPKAPEDTNEEDYFLAHCCAPDGKGGLKPVGIFDTGMLTAENFDFGQSPDRWFLNRRVYRGKNTWLYYNDGEFYADEEGNKAFAHDLLDFRKSLHLERMGDDKPIRGYLREKNDILSGLFEMGDRYMVLVSVMLSSVIVFDRKSMDIIAAYKAGGNIIGFRSVDAERIELTLDKAPYTAVLRINTEAGKKTAVQNCADV